jgi:hypothetical protein
LSSAAQYSPAYLAAPSLAAPANARAATSSIPWYLWIGAIAVTSEAIGGAWDVSWHRSIGRDTFWTPAHLLIQACGILAGVIGLWLVANATFGKDSTLRAASVNIFGLRAPLGVFLAGWGGVAMVTSAPFDNWWHNAYGLDVKIVSPPHTLLILGIRGVELGIMFLILAAMNRAVAVAGAPALSSPALNSPAWQISSPQNPALFRRLQLLFLYLGALALNGQMFFLQEYTFDTYRHQAACYIALGIAVPIAFALLFEASRFRWTCTVISAGYMAFIIAQILIFPLVPAQPKLGPVFNPVTHLVPAAFPILLIVPAVALDLLWQRTRSWKTWQIALVSGIVFIAIVFAVEWNFANFLMSKASENRFFGTTYFGYNATPTSYMRTRRFFQPDAGLALYKGLGIASLCAMASTWLGLTLGRWMRGALR